VPRIPEEWLNSVVYLYPSVEAARQETPRSGAGGTGFIVSLPFENQALSKTLVHHYVVTNDHVRVGAKAMRINLKGEGSDVLIIDGSEWFEHPDGDDVAIRPLELSQNHQYAAVNRSMMLSSEMQDKYNFGPGDEVTFIGRYVDLEGKVHNVPTVRTGIVSVFPAEPIYQKERVHNQTTILVEARSLSGYSGSPVFVTLSPHIEGTIDEAPFVTSLRGSPCFLLGIDYGHHPLRSPVIEKENGHPSGGDKTRDDLYIESNSGMMMIVPAERLLTLLDSPDVVERRREEERNIEELADRVRGHFQKQPKA